MPTFAGGQLELTSLPGGIIMAVLQRNNVQVMVFRRHDEVATLVTDGIATRTYTRSGCRAHGSSKNGIAFLESLGYNIDMEAWG